MRELARFNPAPPQLGSSKIRLWGLLQGIRTSNSRGICAASIIINAFYWLKWLEGVRTWHGVMPGSQQRLATLGVTSASGYLSGRLMCDMRHRTVGAQFEQQTLQSFSRDSEPFAKLRYYSCVLTNSVPDQFIFPCALFMIASSNSE